MIFEHYCSFVTEAKLKGLSLDLFVKTTWVVRMCTIGFISLTVSCGVVKDGWRYVMNGMEEKTCNRTTYVFARVKNLTISSVKLNFCSPDVVSSVSEQTVEGESKVRYLTNTVSSHPEKVWIDRAETCKSRGPYPKNVGEQVPFLDPVDQMNFQICLSTNFPIDPDKPEYTYDKVYLVAPTSQPCPDDSTFLDPATLDCQIP